MSTCSVAKPTSFVSVAKHTWGKYHFRLVPVGGFFVELLNLQRFRKQGARTDHVRCSWLVGRKSLLCALLPHVTVPAAFVMLSYSFPLAFL